MVRNFFSIPLRFMKAMILTLKLKLGKVLRPRIIIILLILFLIWWLNPPERANGADLEMFSELLESGLRFEVHEEVMPNEDEFVRDSFFSFRLLPDLSSPMIFQQYGVGTQNLEIFDRIASKLPLGVDYVYFRDSQYVYSFVYGYLSYSGTSFSGSDVTRINYNTYSGSSQQPTFTVSTVNSFNLSVSNWLVYSNLGDYPSLGGSQGGYRFEVLTQSFLLLFTMFYVLWGFARLRFSR